MGGRGSVRHRDGLQRTDYIQRFAFAEERLETCEVLGVQSVIDICFEVEAELLFGESHFSGSLNCDLRELGQAKIARRQEIRHQFSGNNAIRKSLVARSPDG